jgi:hypothetical protein
MFWVAWANPSIRPDDAAAGFERLREKDRQNRIEHLRRNIGEQAGTSEKERVP